RDPRMPQPHALHGLRHAQRLQRVDRLRLAGLDVAEPAATGARVAEDHERRGAAVPALADVRARRLLAHRVELVALDQPLELEEAGPTGRADLEPRGLALAIGAHLAHVEHPCAAWIGAGTCAHAGTASGSPAAA